MVRLKVWLAERSDSKLVEPSSGLGAAIQYMLNRWEELSMFLRVQCAPIDNNVFERALKKVILHRKNALFFKTENGAEVGDLYLSLIHTAQLARIGPHDYLTALLSHESKVASDATQYFPWNYAATIADVANLSM